METRRTTAKNIDEYILGFPPEVQAILQKMRGVIHAAAPEATEKISYQIPTFYLNGNLVHFAGFKDHISFFPTSSGRAHFGEELAKYKGGAGTIQFPLDQPIPWELIERIVKLRLQENLANGKKKKY